MRCAVLRVKDAGVRGVLKSAPGPVECLEAQKQDDSYLNICPCAPARR